MAKLGDKKIDEIKMQNKNQQTNDQHWHQVFFVVILKDKKNHKFWDKPDEQEFQIHFWAMMVSFFL